MMAAHPKRVEIDADDVAVLTKWAGGRSIERRLAERAQIVLLAAEGRPAAEIAARVGCSEQTVHRQRSAYERDGLAGLADRPRSGRPATHGRPLRRG